MANRALLLFLAVLFAGCSTSAGEPDTAATQSTDVVSATSEEPEPTIEPAEPTVAEALAETVKDTESSTVAPLRPYDDVAPAPTSEVDDSVYITREAMSDVSIGVKWGTHDDAVEYHLHRLARTDDRKPPSEAMTDDNLIHSVFDAGNFVDDDVETGSRYWYGLRALDAEGVAVAHGWHRSAAVTDTEPPSPVGALSAVLDNGEVLVTWTRPDENYELHGYQILRGVDGEEPTTVRRTWNLDQTSFIDDDLPASGSVTYAVVAFDFHWNDSAAAEVAVDLG